MKFNKLIVVLAILAFMLGCSTTKESNGANAEYPKEYVVDGKKLVLTDLDASMSSYGRIFHSKDYPNGIYIEALNGFGGNMLPNATKFIRAQFRDAGFKIVDQVDGADLSIQFSSGGSLSMAGADERAAQSSLPNQSQLTANTGALAAGVITGGIGAGVAFIAGSFIPMDEKSAFTGFAFDKPYIKKGTFGSGIYTLLKEGGNASNQIKIWYKLDKKDKAPEDTVLKFVTAQWMKRYMVLDSAPAAGNAAPVASNVAESAAK